MFQMNPVLIREIRQAVRNRLVLVMMNLYILAMVLLLAYMLLVDSTIRRDSQQVGSDMFMALFVFMNVATTLTVILFTMGRVAFDRISEDAMFISTLRPSRIIWGKFLSGFLISVLFYSLTFPFFTLAYILRGFDFWLIFVAVGVSFSLLQVINLICLTFFSGVRSYLQWILYAVPFLAVGITIGVLGGVAAIASIEGFMYGHQRDSYFIISMAVFGLGIIVPIISFCLAVAQLSPPTANRMFPLRVAISLLILLVFVFALVMNYVIAVNNMSMPDGFGTIIFLLFCAILLTIMSLIFICERADYPIRERQSIPKFFISRLFAYPFFTGASNAVVWMGLLLLLLYPVAFVLAVLLSPEMIRNPYGYDTSNFDDGLWFSTNVITFSVYVFDYCVTALFIRMIFFSKLIQKQYTWLMAVGLFFLGVIATYTFMIAFDISNSYRSYYYDPRNSYEFQMELYHSINPLSFLFDNFAGYRTCQKITAFAWMVFLLLSSTGWQVIQFYKFKRFETNTYAPETVAEETFKDETP